jgi:hypothetical protein
LAQQIQTAMGEITAYPISQGGAEDLRKMSQTLDEMVHQHKAKDTNASFSGWHNAFNAHIINSNRIASITIGAKDNSADMEDCFLFEVNSTNLSVKHNPNSTGTICQGVKNIIEDANYTISGSMLVF